MRPEGIDRAQDLWDGRPYTDYYRLAWRAMIDPKAMERSLYVSILPTQFSHVHAVHSLAMSSNLETALVAGFWASLPLDYVIRVLGLSYLGRHEAQTMPVPSLATP